MFNSSLSKTKVLKQFRGLFTNRWAFGCFALITIQQIIEASSTVWLVTMMTRITNGESFLPFLYLYLAALITPYIPGCLANIVKINWKQEAQKSFIQTFVTTNRDQIAEWSNKNLREEKLSLLTTEGPNAIHAVIDYFFDLFAYVLSVFLTILALSIVVEPLFAIAYVVSVSTVLIVLKIKRRAQRRLTQKALTARIDLYQSLLAAWDNVLLGNEYNFKLWEEKTTQRLNRCLQRNIALERFDQILAIAVSIITAIPCLIVVTHYVYVNRFSVDKLVPFLVTLPLLFTILSYTYQTLTLMFRWAMHKSKLITIYKSIQPIKYCQTTMEKKVKWPKINLEASTQSISTSELSTIAPQDHISMPGPIAITSCQDLLAHTHSSGRVTLRGENGSGKSTLLMLIKNALSEKAFFLPTQNQLSFVAETNKYSTGESLRNRLLEILEKVEADVLLLDEWDANLDNENKERLSELIDELARKKCVIEVRHR